jgi:methionyl-tRNA formyltransferase
MAQPDPNFPVSKTTTPIGMVLQANEAGIWIQTGEGVLHISEIQRSGSKRMPIADLLRGKPIAVGTVCEKAAL